MTVKRVGLARARRAVGLTQEEFAERVGVDRSTVVRWERSVTAPLPYMRPKIASILHLKLREFEDLLSNEGGRRQDWDALARTSDSVVENDLRIVIEIADNGQSNVTYLHDMLNLSKLPLTRLRRDLWFEKTSGSLNVIPVQQDDHGVMIQPIHCTPSMAKFACQIFPAVQPGESVSFGYQCANGVFIGAYYWRETITRFTRQFKLQVTQSGVERLAACSATVEHPDGRENSAAEDLAWRTDDNSVTLSLQQEFLQPNHAVALRWDIERRTSA